MPLQDSQIVRWYAARHCDGDVGKARRLVARWTPVEAARWQQKAAEDDTAVSPADALTLVRKTA